MKLVLKGIWAVPVIASILILGTLGLTPNAYAVTGIITFVNPAGNHGMIELIAGDATTLYQFRIPQDLSDPSYNPSIGDRVEFDIVPENSRLATNVKLSCFGGGTGCGF